MLSIVIPVYNVEAYLGKCLDSMADVFDNSEYEVIIVNDGSTDGSANIAAGYAAKYKNVRLYRKSNGGLSDARNYGMQYVRGGYVMFVDSDDWFAVGAVSRLYDEIRRSQLDILVTNFYYAYKDYLLYDRRFEDRAETLIIHENHEAMQQLVLNTYIKNFAWGKIYRTSLVRDTPFPKGKYFEDVYWQHIIFSRAKKVGYDTIPAYYYRQRESSISGVFTIRNFDFLEGCFRRHSFITKEYPDLLPCMNGQLEGQLHIFHNHSKGNREFMQLTLDYINRYLAMNPEAKKRLNKLMTPNTMDRLLNIIQRILDRFGRSNYKTVSLT